MDGTLSSVGGGMISPYRIGTMKTVNAYDYILGRSGLMLKLSLGFQPKTRKPLKPKITNKGTCV